MLPSIAGILAAQQQLAPYFDATPFSRSINLSKEFAADVWIKDETVSPIRCFKHRGALVELIRVSELRTISTAVTSSTGNHGLGVTYAANKLGVGAHIFLPEGASRVKSEGIKSLGGIVHSVGADIDEAKAEARLFAQRPGHAFVDDGESLGVIEGAGTIGLELVQRLDGVDFVFVPMGSGSLGGGSACAIKSISPETIVICVQSSGAPAMAESFRQRQAVELPINTIADGLVCREPAELALRSLLAFVDDVEVVDDEQILSAVYDLAKTSGLLAEPSGAAALAAMRKRHKEIIGSRVVLVITGANISPETLELLNP